MTLAAKAQSWRSPSSRRHFHPKWWSPGSGDLGPHHVKTSRGSCTSNSQFARHIVTFLCFLQLWCQCPVGGVCNGIRMRRKSSNVFATIFGTLGLSIQPQSWLHWMLKRLNSTMIHNFHTSECWTSPQDVVHEFWLEDFIVIWINITSNRIKLIWFQTFMGLHWPRLLPFQLLVGIHSQKYLSYTVFELGSTTGFMETLTREWSNEFQFGEILRFLGHVLKCLNENLQWFKHNMVFKDLETQDKCIYKTNLLESPHCISSFHNSIWMKRTDMCTSYTFPFTCYVGCSPDALAV